MMFTLQGSLVYHFSFIYGWYIVASLSKGADSYGQNKIKLHCNQACDLFRSITSLYSSIPLYHKEYS